MKNFFLPVARWGAASALALALMVPLGCSKTDTDPLANCRQGSGVQGGIGAAISRNVAFWVAQDFQCGPLQLVSIRNTRTEATETYGQTSNQLNSFFSGGGPVCGSTGTLTVSVRKGDEYEYLFRCSSRTWKAKFTADCSDDCLLVQVK